LSLVRAAKKRCDVVTVSVFVNPTQFGPNEDFSKYPRTFEQDLALLAQEGVDYVFAPAADAMYGKHHRCYVLPEGFDDLPEGICRPGHFRGVATVVTKLFNIVSPTHAFFGQKDAAQCVLMKRLVGDLNMDIEIEVVPVNREPDGLARSTRNQYLSAEERAVAGVVHRGLSLAKAFFFQQTGDVVASKDLRAIIRAEYETEPLLKEIQYISIGSKETMQEVEQVSRQEGAILSVAVKLGNCRLIDTMTV
jgi:pantoate--beta-alanine ligase